MISQSKDQELDEYKKYISQINKIQTQTFDLLRGKPFLANSILGHLQQKSLFVFLFLAHVGLKYHHAHLSLILFVD